MARAHFLRSPILPLTCAIVILNHSFVIRKWKGLNLSLSLPSEPFGLVHFPPMTSWGFSIGFTGWEEIRGWLISTQVEWSDGPRKDFLGENVCLKVLVPLTFDPRIYPALTRVHFVTIFSGVSLLHSYIFLC